MGRKTSRAARVFFDRLAAPRWIHTALAVVFLQLVRPVPRWVHTALAVDFLPLARPKKFSLSR
eukprot:4255766-Amphidinium_carterae.2